MSSAPEAAASASVPAAREPAPVHRWLAALVAALAVVALVGWVTGLPRLTTFVQGRPTLAPMTAIVLLLAARAMAALPEDKAIALRYGLAQAACGLFIMVAHQFALPATDTLVPSFWWSSRLSGLAFAMSGLATVLLALRRFAAGQIVALGVLLLASLLGLGHVFPDADLYTLMPGTGVAIPSVLAFVVLSIGQLRACHTRGIAGALTRHSAAGRAGLRLLSVGLFSVLGLTVAVVIARRHGLFDADTAVLLVAWGAIALLGSALWGLAVAVARVEAARQVAEEERDRVQRMVAAAVAHDLRNPLSTAVATASLLQRQVAELQATAALQRLQRSHRRLDRLLRSLLDSMTVSAGKPLALKMGPCALHELVAEVVAENEAALAGRLSCEGEAHGWWDRDAMLRVIENLVLNAVKYGDRDSPIVCRITPMDSTDVLLEIGNQGAAIPHAEWETIFHPFTGGQETARRQPGGWGVGLAYAKAVAVGHGGSIGVTKSDATGTTFSLWLPLDARPHALLLEPGHTGLR
ncbi:sensor histidine kinase KdpD [Piscinibacter sp. HJYY11]|uniref:sensor histidine kinase n=1 Tax=Piscinibacter sp. HJYY11 TaxID=2801333 RepID=UPI00191F0864|nr:HAMP domain-containing sensor histidine kinase [Piscinibacter sp. HJYY11]MBL0727206.1 HAMP domain-containing histidine kinase [Piscinibacter sp. HJYY11]